MRPSLCAAAGLLLTAALAGLTPTAAFAQARLRSQGSTAGELQRIALKAATEIDGQFATTRLEVVYRNNDYARLEADFEYVLPPDTLASSFAYWFGDEKVVARVVEKERAAEIYRHITTRQRDPALIERVDDRTFRARIFPIEGGADLRVEMVFRQVLPSDSGGWVYQLPLVGEDNEVLEKIDARIRIRPGPSPAGVRNNLGIPIESTEQGSKIVLSGENYRPAKDLRVRIVRPPKALHTSLLAATSGGAHGYFALALTPSRTLRRPVVRLQGPVYGVHVPSGSLGAHRTITVTGRYRHGGPLHAALSDGSGDYAAQARVELGSKRAANNTAALLWASREIARSEKWGQKRRAIQLSKRFGLPGKDTSWLAVPISEMARYRQEKEGERLEVVADALVRLWHAGRERTPRARRLNAELNRICNRAGYSRVQTLQYRLWHETYTRARGFLFEKHRRAPDPARLRSTRASLKRIASFFGQTPEELSAQYETEVVRDVLVEERSRPKPDTERVRRLEARFLELHQHPESKVRARVRLERLAVRSDLEKVEKRLAEIRPPSVGDDPDRQRNQRLEKQGLEMRQSQLTARYEELRARMGDPLISVEAPADAQRVVALMPDGTVKPLTYRPDTGRWEVRFDIPKYAAEGGYTVQVIIVHPDGRRSLARFTFTVDITAPSAVARVLRAPRKPARLWVAIDAAEDTARVCAYLPGGTIVPLRKAEGTQYSGWIELPAGASDTERIKIVVTDKAHNRTILEVAPREAEGRDVKPGAVAPGAPVAEDGP